MIYKLLNKYTIYILLLVIIYILVSNSIIKYDNSKELYHRNNQKVMLEGYTLGYNDIIQIDNNIVHTYQSLPYPLYSKISVEGKLIAKYIKTDYWDRNQTYYYVKNSTITLLEWNTLLEFALNIHQYIDNILWDSYNKEYSFLKAITLADKTNLNWDLKDLFKNTGVYHLLVISGFHIGIIIFVIFLLFKKHWLRLLISFIVLIVINLTTGFGISILRASLMILIGLLLYRKLHRLTILYLVAFLMLIINPSLLYNIGFQMSVLSVFAILYYVIPVISKYNSKSIIDILKSSLILTIYINIVISIILITIFKYISIISPISNVIMSILFPIIYITLLLSIVFNSLPILNTILIHAVKYLYTIIIYILEILNIDMITITDRDIPIFIMIYVIIIMLITYYRNHKKIMNKKDTKYIY